LEFERAVYYESDNSKIAQYKYFKSLCYKNLNENSKALKVLNEINLYNLPDSLYIRIRYEQAYCNFLNEEPGKSIWNIDEIRFRYPDSSDTRDLIPLNVLCLNSLRKWEDAISLWNYYLNDLGLPDSLYEQFQQEFNTLYRKRNIPKYHSPGTAVNLSRFIPGAGQVYCGAYREGAFNFLINAAILGYSFYEFYSRYYFTGYIVGLGLLNKTYSGGLHRAKLLAEEKNRKSVNNFNMEAGSLMVKIIETANLYNPPLQPHFILIQ
jgi:hypothetical protein